LTNGIIYDTIILRPKGVKKERERGRDYEQEVILL